MIERDELVGLLSKVKILEEEVRPKIPPPKQAIILGGGGVTGKNYGPRFAKAGLEVCAIIDTTPKEQTVSLETLTKAEYYQVPHDFSTEQILKIVEGFPKTAMVVMTPQNTHASILETIAPVVLERSIPTWIDKPLVMSADEVLRIGHLISRYPRLAHLVLSGGYTIDKATAELAFFGILPKDYPGLTKVKPHPNAPNSPDFKEKFLKDVDISTLGKLKAVRFLFMEGDLDKREVIGRYGRTHLAYYPGGGMVGDLMEHLADKLIRLGLIDLESEFLNVYLGYTPIGENSTSFPWQVPKTKGLAEIEAEVIMYGKDRVPILLNFGKRQPLSIGDVRRSRLVFDNGVIETNYLTSKDLPSNLFSIKFGDSKEYKYYLDEDPYALMLQRYQTLWSGGLPGQGGIYTQLVNALLMGDTYRVWFGQEPLMFRRSEKADKYRRKKYSESEIEKYRQRQEIDLKSIID